MGFSSELSFPFGRVRSSCPVRKILGVVAHGSPSAFQRLCQWLQPAEQFTHQTDIDGYSDLISDRLV